MDSGILSFIESLDDEFMGLWMMVKINNGNDVFVDFCYIDGIMESLLGFFISDFIFFIELVRFV